jgi:chitin disaccharide deacetylase
VHLLPGNGRWPLGTRAEHAKERTSHLPAVRRVDRMIILCADDYAMTAGISRAIGELAAARRLSATSAVVTTPHWPAMAQRLAVHRAHLAIGLHLNLTLGNPLGRMHKLAPAGAFPGLKALLRRAALGALDSREIRGEIERQLDHFEARLGFAPDHIDAHQHVQVLPSIRHPLLETVVLRYPQRPPLLRNPADRLRAIIARRLAVPKAIAVSLLATGFARAARRRGLPSSDGFAGFSDFDLRRPYAEELACALQSPGRRHIVMCHPGHPDAELARLDSVVERRRMEYTCLMRDTGLQHVIWRPARKSDGPSLFWPQLQSDG